MAVVVLDNRLLDLVEPDVGVDQIATGFQFTEGPLWDPRDGSLLFSDVRGQSLYRWSSGGVQLLRGPADSGITNGNTWDRDGSLLSCEHAGRRISRTLADGRIETVVDYWGKARFNSPNDVIVAPSGDILFTDPLYGLRQPDGSFQGMEYDDLGVFRYSPATGELRLLVGDFEAPNGLALTNDASTLYVCDTVRHHIRAFDVAADGSLGNDRVLCEVVHGETQGRPDGMKLDAVGNLYVTANSPEGIWVFDPQGVHLGFIGLGENPANLAWGGDDWRTIFATAQTSVYRLRMKVAGQPPRFTP